ncbi:ABC transporter permease [Sciscionella marina]|uniref:ABC transporter permease n=1 Tax=Sciscionella marina TaxID=508770 RepID=UPI00037F84A1|nr:ABC transporter permease [Sciscionella marina]
MVLNTDWRLLTGVCVTLTVLAALVSRYGHLLGGYPVARAAVRAIVQLAAVSAIITFVLQYLSLTLLFVLVMAVVATATSAARIQSAPGGSRRSRAGVRSAGVPRDTRARDRQGGGMSRSGVLRRLTTTRRGADLACEGTSPTSQRSRTRDPRVRSRTRRRGLTVGLAICAGTVPLLAALIGVGLLPATGIALIPVGGILIGGAMTATTLSARRGLDELHDRYGEYEAALSLGLTERDAVCEVIRRPAAEALVPALDQTRTVGLVTLPGAFVGMLLGGASPWEAGALQLVVLLGLLVVEGLAILVVVELIAAGWVRREISK